MKRFLSALIILSIIFSLCACSMADISNTTPSSQETTAPTTETTEETTPNAPDSLKVLAIGNSFSVDAMWQLYPIAKAEGVKQIVLGNLFVGSCTLEMHADYAKNNKDAYRYYKNTKGIWDTTEGVTLLRALQDEEWDVIVMQQGSAVSGIPSSYTPYMNDLITYVKSNMTNPDCKLYWHMTWAYQSDSTHNAFPKYGSNQLTMYDCISKTVQNVVEPSGAFAGVFPVGTAIQNARTGFVGDTLTRDGHHLSNYGRVLASYTWYAVLTGHPLTEIHVKSFDVGVSLSENHKKLIVSAVNAAIGQPYEVTEQ